MLFQYPALFGEKAAFSGLQRAFLILTKRAEKDGRDSFDSDKLTLEQEEGW